MTAIKADSSHVEKAVRKGLVSPPRWLLTNLMFEGITGSEAYGCRDPIIGDRDIVGFCVPPKHFVFPHLAGHIPGFAIQEVESFNEWQQHHVEDKQSRVIYDFAIYGIVRFFQDRKSVV